MLEKKCVETSGILLLTDIIQKRKHGCRRLQRNDESETTAPDENLHCTIHHVAIRKRNELAPKNKKSKTFFKKNATIRKHGVMC